MRKFTSWLMLLCLLAPLVPFEQAELESIPEPAETVGNLTTGGWHIATGEWWEPSRPFSVTASDSDGDGAANSVDPKPLDPAIRVLERLAGTACFHSNGPCTQNPTATPYSPDIQTVDPLGSHALALAWGDVDRDGDLDLAVANNGEANVVYVNEGNQLTATKAWTSPDAKITMDIAWVDVDLDGDLDLATVDYEGAAQIYRNDAGVLSTAAMWYFVDGSMLWSKLTAMDWGDVDGDGDMDLVIANKGSDLLYFRNNGGQMPTSPTWERNSGRATTDIVLADINGDGKLDLIEGVGSGANHLYRASGSSFSSFTSWQSSNSLPTASLAAADVDGDGDVDLVVGNRGQQNELWMNTGSNFASVPAWTSSYLNQTTGVVLADIDRDGDMDLLETNANEEDRIYIFDLNEFGTSASWTHQANQDSARGAFGDLDGDGDLDFAIPDGSAGPQIYYRGGHALSTNSAWNDGVAAYTYSIEADDMDGDGDLDLAIGNAYGVSRVYENQDMSFTSVWDSSTSYYADDMIFFDTNGDGDKEIVLADYNGRNKAWSGLRDAQTNAYSISSNCCVWQSTDSDYTEDFVVGDVNGDGIDDLVTLNYGYNRVNLMIQSGGSGNWALSQQDSWGNSYYRESKCGALADFNQDGHLDLYVGNYYERDQMFLNNGGGFVHPESWQSVGSDPVQDCAAGDVNGDGYPDVVVATETGYNALFLNHNGALSTAPDWVTPEQDDTVSIGLWDVDADGDLDWVEGNYGGTANRIRENVDGNFSSTIWESASNMDSWMVKMADMEGDGDLDLIVANEQQTNQIFLSSRDQDGDWISEDTFDNSPFDPTQINDADGDGFGDRAQGWRPDDCINSWGDSWRDRWGCTDLDKDGQSDLFDPFMQHPSQWSDLDGDGLGDNWRDPSLNATRLSRGLGEWLEGAHLPDPRPWDYDNDGYEDEGLDGAQAPFDDCPFSAGSSRLDRFGCADADVDGWSDEGDAFPGEPTQWNDTDGDSFGDHAKGVQPDACPLEYGNSELDRFGCADTDGDGWSDANDFDPLDPEVWSDEDRDDWNDQNADHCIGTAGTSREDQQGCPDRDRDGWSDEGDAFPDDVSQWSDVDGDGYGDYSDGREPDACFLDPGTSRFRVLNDTYLPWFGCEDSDNDGLWDVSDACPLEGGTSTLDRHGCADADGDGMSDANDDCIMQPGDSTILATACPDMDRDGIPDHLDPDPSDGVGKADDLDADGVNNTVDAFPNDPSQWADADGDGLGDNPHGSMPDPSPGDADNDGTPDSEDPFPNDPLERSDHDGDGIGDVADLDDDDDGYTDVQELNANTDPLDSSDHPIEGWEWIVPGTQIGLSVWDLIGIFAGVPLAAWLGFGLVTRNGRTAAFERRMEAAQSREMLEQVANEYEFALMLRLIGPHQGIRLERQRAELDDAIEDIERGFAGGQGPITIETDQGELALSESRPGKDRVGIKDEHGYEWIQHDGERWFRAGDDVEWSRWEPAQ